MPKGRQTVRRKAAPAARPALDRLRETWAAARHAVISTERQMEEQVRGLLRDSAGSREATQALERLRTRAERERRRALAALESRARTLQARLGRERKALGRSVRENVQPALAALDIPTRDEIARLSRRVETLSRRIAARKR